MFDACLVDRCLLNELCIYFVIYLIIINPKSRHNEVFVENNMSLVCMGIKDLEMRS